ncbi:MAG: GAF domain-containing protein [Myxococcota bacterium]|nr:GAF domain-containing protein [Myxococcota bacterium]
MEKTELEPKELLGFASKREEFFETFFRKGAEFANELLKELETLRHDTALLTEENVSLRHQLASDDAIRDLLKKIESLESEKHKMREHIQNAAARTEDYAGRYAEVERELDTMANLYVALYQLHSTLSPEEVLGVIEQLLAQFIGAGSFVIYLRSDDGDVPVLKPVHAYHCEEVTGTRIRWGEGPIGEAASTQVHSVADPALGEAGAPLACVPMVLRGETIGVIAILGFFEQKQSFVDIDFDFFKLLGVHSASAIVGSGLMARAGDISPGLESYKYL